MAVVIIGCPGVVEMEEIVSEEDAEQGQTDAALPETVTRWAGSRTAWEKRASSVRLGRGAEAVLAAAVQASSLITAISVRPSGRLGDTHPRLILVGLDPAWPEPSQWFGSRAAVRVPCRLISSLVETSRAASRAIFRCASSLN